MLSSVQDTRGIPLWLLREYLVELDGTAVDEFNVQGDGWRAQLERLEPFRLGSLEIGQVRVSLEIEAAIQEDFLRRFALKTMRAGG